MAYAFLSAMGLDGQIGEVDIDLAADKAEASDGHTIKPIGKGKFQITSERFPFCSSGPLDRDNSIRSGMTLVPFAEDLNRFTLKVDSAVDGQYRVTWGAESQEFSGDELRKGINLAEAFADNPFAEAFDQVDQAVAAKQKFETRQIKEIFHGAQGKANLEKAVSETEAERKPLAEAIRETMVPVTHEIEIVSLGP
jgi:hypothetical protein